MIVSLNTFLEHLNTLLEWNEKDRVRCLFPSETHSSQELLDKARTIESYSFYGRHAAFQYCSSIESVLKGLLTIMAGYSDYYFSTSPHLWRVAKSLFMSTQYTLDAEHRARRIVHASQYATVDFCKSFWFLAESDLMKKVPDRICPAIRVNQLILIPPEPLQIDSTKCKPVNIPAPSAHGPIAPIQVRLLSAKGRPGMPGQNDYSEATVSDSLIIHCHGGGFVAQSSSSHETVGQVNSLFKWFIC
jgi:hormone-sensitive lipase